MKRLIIGLIIFSFTNLVATEKIDISTGSNYSNDVYFNFKNAETHVLENSNWDIGFSLVDKGAAGSAIIINEAYVELYSAPYDTTRWESFDTTNLNTWERLYNPKISWTNGAYNIYRGERSALDMGWGVLMPELNFWTYGDSLYTIKLQSGNFIKFKINSLKQGVWEFSYSDIDNSNEETIEINKADYTNKNFIYFNFQNKEIIDREPLKETWDIVFTKYMYFAESVVKYNTTLGVLNDSDIKISKMQGSIEDKFETKEEEFLDNISLIGNDWKTFDMSAFVWAVEKENVYIIKTENNELYNLTFLTFGGKDNGNLSFQYKKVSPSSITENGSVAFYPNPVSNFGNIVLDNNYYGEVIITIHNIHGKLINEYSLNKSSEFQNYALKLQNMNKGIYILNIKYENKIEHIKIIKE